MAYGGQIFNEQPALREKVPGLFLGETLREGINKLDSQLHTLLTPRV